MRNSEHNDPLEIPTLAFVFANITHRAVRRFVRVLTLLGLKSTDTGCTACWRENCERVVPSHSVARCMPHPNYKRPGLLAGDMPLRSVCVYPVPASLYRLVERNPSNQKKPPLGRDLFPVLYGVYLLLT